MFVPHNESRSLIPFVSIDFRVLFCFRKTKRMGEIRFVTFQCSPIVFLWQKYVTQNVRFFDFFVLGPKGQLQIHNTRIIVREQMINNRESFLTHLRPHTSCGLIRAEREDIHLG